MAALLPSTLLASLISLFHAYVLVLQMFLWTTPRSRKTFRLTPEFAQQTGSLAANQGLYNGFLAAGLAWGVAHPVDHFGAQIRLFFLGCVAVAGSYGGATAGRKIMYVQGVPAFVALGFALGGL